MWQKRCEPTDDAGLRIAPYDVDDSLATATRRDGRARLRVYVPSDTAVVLGRGSEPAVELDVAACRSDGIPIVRRRGGGCAVVIDPGNVIVIASRPLAGLDRIRPTYDEMTRWLIDGLVALGVPGVQAAGTSDLALEDRKVSGSCVHRTLGFFTYSATLLVDPDVSLLERYLAHPPREPGYRRGRGHAAFVGKLSDRSPLSPRAFGEALERVLAAAGWLDAPQEPA